MQIPIVRLEMKRLAATVVGIVLVVGTACSAACLGHAAQASCHSDHHTEDSNAPDATCLDKDSLFSGKLSRGDVLSLPAVSVAVLLPEPTVVTVTQTRLVTPCFLKTLPPWF
jgi:hypothetical protein